MEVGGGFAMTARKSVTLDYSSKFEFHPLANPFPLMEGAEFDALVADIKANGLRQPIIIDEGMILDGRNRYRALKALNDPGIDKRTIQQVQKGTLVHHYFRTLTQLSVDNPAAYVISANIHRRHLTAEQKREVIAKLIAAQPEKSNRQIAKQAKVDHKIVAAVRQGKEGRGEFPHVETRTDTKGRKQPAKKAAAERNRKARAGRAEKGKQRRDAELPAFEAEEEKIVAKAALLAADLKKAGLAERVLAFLRWQEGDPQVLQDALHDLLRSATAAAPPPAADVSVTGNADIDGPEENADSPETSAEAMKAKFAADDGLDIPECLRREPAAAAP